MKKKGFHLSIFALTGMMMFSKAALPSYASGERWIQQNGIWNLQKEDGSYAVGWAQVAEKWYYFNEQGTMLSNWVKPSDNKWYYLNETTGAMETGWLEKDGNWYYLDTTTGAMQTGWIKVGDKDYYLSSDGSMVTGTKIIDGVTYQFDNDGSYIGPQSDEDSQKLYAERVVELVNIERQKEGLDPLEIDEDLMEVAQLRAGETVTVFSHTRPNGATCFTAFNEAGITYKNAGENIAAGQSTPEQVVDAWMNSSGHRANILGNYTHIGVGFVNSSSGYSYYWVQCFITKK